MESIIFTRVKELCEQNHISINKLENELGFSNYSIGKWRNDVSPTIDKIARIAAYFHISIDYIAGVSDIKTPADSLIQDQDMVSLQRAREKLSPQDKDRMMKIIKLGFYHAFEDGEETSE